MPLHGGIIGISILGGLSSYESNIDKEKTFKINVLPLAEGSALSFTTYKIDNIDFSEKEIRIIDSQARPSFVGYYFYNFLLLILYIRKIRN